MDFYFYYTSAKQGKPGLSVTVDVYDPAGAQVVTDGPAVEVGGGIYRYSYAGQGSHVAVAKVSDASVDCQHIPALHAAYVDNLDAAISSRSTLQAADLPPAPDNAGIAAIRAKTDNLPDDPARESTVESRLAAADYSAPPTPPTPAEIAAEVQADPRLAHLDAPVSSRLAASDYSAPVIPPSAQEVAAAIWQHPERELTQEIKATAEIDPVAVGAAVWNYATRTLTMQVTQIRDAMTGGALSIVRGDTVKVSLAGISGLAGRQQLWFAVKANADQDDDQAAVLLTEASGLVVLSGALATPAQGSITVTDDVAGALDIKLAAAATAQLAPASGLRWELQVQTADGSINTLAGGSFAVMADIVRATA